MAEAAAARGTAVVADPDAFGTAAPAARARTDVTAGLVSLVIPCFNEESVLAATLDHLLPHLRGAGVELIVSDDGSADGSVAIARGRGCRVIESDGAPRSAARARNRGAAAARGEILLFIDADIRLDRPARFFAALRERFRDPRLVAATARCRVYPEMESGWDRAYHLLYDAFTAACNRLGLGTAGGWCQAVRRPAFQAVGGYDPFFTSGQDVDLFFRLGRRGRTRLLPEITIYESPRRYRAEGLARTAVRWLLNGIWVCVLRRPYLKRYRPVR